jgi:hypothetical protein
MEVAQGEGEVICAGLCVEGRRRVVRDDFTKEQGGAPEGCGREGPSSREG